MTNRHAHIGVVGAGPRGLSVLERLFAQERKSPRRERLTVHLVDPFPPGPGRVWRTRQSAHLLMNTVASQVTLFTDSSVRVEGPIEEGPSLYAWARELACQEESAAPDAGTLAEARRLGPDSYPTRAFYGHYLEWVRRRLLATAPSHVTVRSHVARAVALDHPAGPDGPQTLLLDDGTELAGLDAVVLAQGHVPALPTAGERRLVDFAARHGLTYLPPDNPADVELDGIGPGRPVLLRGLGLNFFDYLALFTTGRGGRFDRAGDRLVYRPSGHEPRLYAGSRRGVPYHARGENEKGPHGRHEPVLLTPRRIEEMRARVRAGDWLHFGTDLWPLIDREVTGVYYAALLTARGRDAGPFTKAYPAAADDAACEALLTAEDITPGERWDWERIARPYGDRTFSSTAEYRTWLLPQLYRDVAEARAGNVSGPLKAALDVLRDLRNEIRLAVDHGGLEGNSHRDDLYGWYTPLNAFLSIGPPTSRIEELCALIEAGVVEILPPGLKVAATEDLPGGPAFTAATPRTGQAAPPCTVLIEARLPEPDLRRTADPLLRHLLDTGQCRPHRIAGTCGTSYETGGLAVTERPYRLVDAAGRPHPRRFAYGVPTESVHWVTAAGIRPGVGSVTLEDSDAIARAVLALPPLRPDTDVAAATGLTEEVHA
ncbi:FAD/NAD(P)-binding protein [Streptomyces sp. NPDC052052]|uniref:FAD/NAD(P)-binding protein n=1 Tax=Streptomyces sp. NPDC052052 TaxID=3154756 RepID=UPI0034221947